MKYAVELAPRAWKQLEKLSDSLQGRILDKLDELSTEPRPSGCKKLKGEEHAYRVRVGDFRIIYEVADKRLLVYVFDVVNRRDAYR